MSYELDAILAKRDAISKWKPKPTLVYPLTDELGLIPKVSDQFFTEIKSLETWAKQASKGTLVAHLTASFFGGSGSHDCTLWIDGKQFKTGLNINEVLAQFGVESTSADAFDAVGLGRFRRNERWAAHAVVDPIKNSVDALIDTLAFKCGDQYVDSATRSAAAERLGELKAVEALDALKQTLQDPDYGTRLSASGALGKIGLPAVPILIDALSTFEEKPQDLWGIVFDLGKVGRPAESAAPHLNRLLKHDDWRIRIEVVRTLAAMGCVGPEVQELLNDSQELVRNAAREALG